MNGMTVRTLAAQALAAGALAGLAACDGREAAPVSAPLPATGQQQQRPASERPQEPARERVSGREDPHAERAARGPEDGSLRVADITGDIARHLGQQVTVRGEVAAIHGTRAFDLSDDAAPERGPAGLTVVGGRTVRWLIDDEWAGDAVRARGTVRRGKAADLERELRRQLEPELREALDGESIVLVAEDVHPLRSDEPQR